MIFEANNYNNCPNSYQVEKNIDNQRYEEVVAAIAYLRFRLDQSVLSNFCKFEEAGEFILFLMEEKPSGRLEAHGRAKILGAFNRTNFYPLVFKKLWGQKEIASLQTLEDDMVPLYLENYSKELKQLDQKVTVVHKKVVFAEEVTIYPIPKRRITSNPAKKEAVTKGVSGNSCDSNNNSSVTK